VYLLQSYGLPDEEDLGGSEGVFLVVSTSSIKPISRAPSAGIKWSRSSSFSVAASVGGRNFGITAAAVEHTNLLESV
jgi:hypothetical protein